MKRKVFKRITSLLSTAALLLTSADFSTLNCSVYADDSPVLKPYDVNGNGSIEAGETAYPLDSVNDLYWFADKVNNENATYGSANAFLAADITVNSGVLVNGELNEAEKENFREWTPIGDPEKQYKGTFDGADHTISGLYFINNEQEDVGLFGYVDGGTIRNVSIADSYLYGKFYVGGVCGLNNKGTIANCMNQGAVTGAVDVGGICGRMMNNASITGCYNTGAISGESTVDLNGEIGGICGYIINESIISHCYNKGKVKGKEFIGGVCGYNVSCKVENCYNSGIIEYETPYFGEIDGMDKEGGIITNCYYLAEAEDANGGKTAAQFASGEVCWLLNGGETQAETPAFYQTIGTDEIPVLDSTHHAVKHSETSYYNEHTDFDENGFCTVCGNGYQPATTVKDVYDIDGDDETSDDVYEISNAGQLYWFAGLVNGTLGGVKRIRYANAVLKNDITVNSGVLNENGELNEGDFRVWTPIGYYDSVNKKSYSYMGAFDGAGHTISGLYFNDSGAAHVGLFGFVSNGESNNKIMNLTVADSYFCGNKNVGGVCGYSALVAIQKCSNTGKVTGDEYVGGVCGYISKRVIENCYNTGKVSGNSYIGGICGYNCEKNTIQNCYNTGAVSGNTIVGGICGKVNYTSLSSNAYTMVTNCYNTGKVSGNTYVGSINGSGESKLIENCYYLGAEGVNGRGGGPDYADSTEVKSAEQFASGEVCWLLNGGKTQAETPTFYQTLGEDAFPVLDSTHNTVYKNTACDGVSGYYNNGNKNQEHSFGDNGICTICDGYEPATDLNNDGVYEISNAGQLYWFADKVNNDNDNYGEANAVLTNDITVNSGVLDENGELNEGDFRKWTPVGQWTSEGTQKYKGTFDGKGHTVSGLYFNDNSEESGRFVGLFGDISGTVKNVGIIESYFCGNTYIGGISGYSEGGKIKNCYNTGTVKGVDTFGGICGETIYGEITNCYNTGDVTLPFQYASVGGVCGSNFGATIENCYYLNTVAEDSNATAMSASQFASGEVCWLLNGGERQADTPAFFQKLEGKKDDLPVLDSNHGRVYLTTHCVTYSNTSGMKNHTLHSEKKDVTCTEDGHTEYWYCTDCGKYFSDADCAKEIENFETWMSENTFPASGHNYQDGICKNCGAFEDGIGAKLAGYSLSLDGSISVNFYMELAEPVIKDENAYLLVTYPNGTDDKMLVRDVQPTYMNGKQYYIFNCKVAATEMADTITAQIMTLVADGTKYSYSVKEYADYLLAHTKENVEYAEAAPFVKAMLNYGAYAQTFKGYKKDTLPCTPSDVSEYVIQEHGYTAGAGNTVKFAGANLSMLSNMTLRLFFKADNIKDITFKKGSEKLAIGENNGLYYVEIENISPNKLSEDFTVSVMEGQNTFDVTYSPMTYCYQAAKNSQDTALVNLVKAIAQYNDAAKAYFKEAKK